MAFIRSDFSNYSIHVSVEPYDGRRGYDELEPCMEFYTKSKLFFCSSDSSCATKLPEVDLLSGPFKYPRQVFDTMPQSREVISGLLSSTDNVPFQLDDYIVWFEKKKRLKDIADLIEHVVEFTRVMLRNHYRRGDETNVGLVLVIEKTTYLPRCEFEAIRAAKVSEEKERTESEVRSWITQMARGMKPDQIDYLEPFVSIAMKPCTKPIFDKHVFDVECLKQSFMKQAIRELEALGMLSSSASSSQAPAMVDIGHHCDDQGLKEQCCSICLMDFSCYSDVFRTPCSHMFHNDCIRKWLEKKKDCPLCRLKI